MKNNKLKINIRKIFLGKLTREMLIVNIIMISLLVVITFNNVYNLVDFTKRSKSAESIINSCNKGYIELIRYIHDDSTNSRNYLNKVATLNSINIIIADNKDNIVMKSQKVKVNKISYSHIYESLKSSNKNETLAFQAYDIKINNENMKIYMYDYINDKFIEKQANGIVTEIIVILFIMVYLIPRRKLKYIKHIGKEINEIGKGDLNRRIKVQGYDELSTIAYQINEMTEKIKASIEEEKKQEEFKNELITNISHDLRTPLTSIIAYLQLINDNNLKGDIGKKAIETSLRNAKNLKILVDDLFEFTKLQNNDITFDKCRVNIIELLEQVIGEQSIDCRDKNLNIVKNFPKDFVEINIDPNKMGRVFSNILDNAIKYSIEESYIIVETIKKKEFIEINFINKSNYKLEENLEKFLERSYRGDKSRSNEVKGSGLGLAIVQTILQHQNGEIELLKENNNFIAKVILKIN